MNTRQARPTGGKKRVYKSRRRSNRSPSSHGRSFRNRDQGRTRSGRKLPTFDPTKFINKNPVEYKEEVYEPKYSFNDFAVHPKIKSALKQHGLVTPSPIQDQVIKPILSGKDVVGLAETGTGKTAAFLIPTIERRLQQTNGITLIMTPTRELALQVEAEFRKLSAGLRLFSTVCVGGTNIGPQLRQLKRRNHFIIGTPGRLKDLIDRGKIRTELIDTVILDEADRMLDMGFIHDMRQILGELPPKRHTLFFSATMDDKTASLVSEFMADPITVSVKKKDVTDSIAQDVIPYSHAHKYDTLVTLLNNDDEYRRVIVFGAMKHSVEKLGKALSQSGISTESIHGNKSHSQRQRSLNRFKSGQVRVLTATDVAARGIHVDNVSHVINYDLPGTFEDYVHRIGRTGRGTKRGKALTFIPS